MLEGLEISEVLLSEIVRNNRIDAECYMKENLLLNRIVESHKHKSIYEFATITDGEHGSPDLDENSGILYLSGHNVKDNVLDLSDVRYCSEQLHKKNSRSALTKNSVLLSIVGTVGNASVVYQDIVANTDRNVATIKNISDLVNPYYLSTFLISKFGKFQTHLLSTGNVQPLLNLLQVKSIRVCLPEKDFQLKIETIVKTAHTNLSKSKSLYSDAENILLSELGFKKWQPNNAPINIKQLKESFLTSGRLDAEYYQPKYDEIENIIKNYKNGTEVIGDLFTQNTEVCDFKEEAYNYIEIGDINISDGTANYNLISKEELPDNAKRVLHKNDILISKVRPYRGAVSIIDFDDDKLIGSGAFTVLHEKTTYKKEVLQILLRIQVYRDWLLKWNVGSSYPVIKDEDILRLPIPLIPQNIQTKIAEYVQKSIALRKEAKQLLENAKLQVEDAIFTPPHLIENQLVIKHNQMVEESIYYYRLAEWTLLQELYAEKWTTNITANYSIKNYSVCKTAGRLDAEYYQPKYDDLFFRLSQFECDTIKDIANIKKSVEPGSEAYQESGIPFVRVSDVTKFGISEPNVFLSQNDYDLKELQPKKDTILLSKDGSVGIAYKVEEDTDCITSGALLHLSVFNKEYNSDYLTLVLNSKVVQMQAERDSNGAIIQHWKPSEIEQVIIPKLPKPIQETISARIQESFALKAESKRLLDEAKMMVEREIEIR